MANIRMRRRHELGLDTARQRADAVAQELEAEHPNLVQTIDWNADHTEAEVRGRGFKGQLSLSESDVSVEVELGFLARPFRSRVQATLEDRLSEHFA